MITLGGDDGMKTMTIKEVAQLSGVSVRTLQYYDKMGLLAPDDFTDAGYRQYSMENLLKLQRILMYKELGFSLKEIKVELLEDNREERLKQQKELLILKKENLERMINLADKLISGETDLNFEVFKKTLQSQIPTDFQEMADELELLTPERFEEFNELYGENGLFQAQINISQEDLLSTITQAGELLKAAVSEQEESKALEIIKQWLELSAVGYQVKNPESLPNILFKDYMSNELVIQQTDAMFGKGASQKIGLLLQKIINNGG